MDERNFHWIIVGLSLVVLLSVVVMGGTRQITISNQEDKISVSASAEKDVMPDKAILSLTVLTEGSDPKLIQEQNSLKIGQVMDALKSAGITDVETSNYNLYPWQEWDGQKMISKGYKLQHTLKVTTTDINQVGKLLDFSVKNGINEISNIVFTLSKSKEQEIKTELINEASKSAKTKAKALAEGLDVSLGKVLSVSESSYSGGPWIYASKMATAEAASTTVNPEQVKVSLQVNVDFAIKDSLI